MYECIKTREVHKNVTFRNNVHSDIGVDSGGTKLKCYDDEMNLSDQQPCVSMSQNQLLSTKFPKMESDNSSHIKTIATSASS